MLKEKYVSDLYLNLGGHGFDHVQRVHRLAMNISKKEKSKHRNLDLKVVDASSWLHDIARVDEDSGKCKCHAQEGAKRSAIILGKLNYSKEQISKVQHAIASHRYSKGLKAETIEAKILQDADRLDALGAICIARVFVYNGYKQTPIYDPKIKPEKNYHGQNTTAINHFYEKILKIKPNTFHTAYAKELAKERYEFIKTFLNKFKSEWIGKN